MRTDKYGTCLVEIQKDVEGETFGKNEDGTTWHQLLPFIEKIPPFKKGNILYVRETWTLEEFYDDVNYNLDRFYDFCDDLKIWIPI